MIAGQSVRSVPRPRIPASCKSGRSGRTRIAIGRQPHARVAPQRRAAAGFTLLELLVVMVILGLLASYVGPRFFAQIGKSETSVARTQVEAFEKALDQFRIDVGRYPTTEEGLAALNTKPGELAKWNGPYLKKAVPLDPWGKPYVYRAPGAKGDFELLSFGKDGAQGGTGDAADITNQ